MQSKVNSAKILYSAEFQKGTSGNALIASGYIFMCIIYQSWAIDS
jgi:hypothetical protein